MMLLHFMAYSFRLQQLVQYSSAAMPKDRTTIYKRALEQVVASPEQQQLSKAIKDELQSLHRNGTLKLNTPPLGVHLQDQTQSAKIMTMVKQMGCCPR